MMINMIPHNTRNHQGIEIVKTFAEGDAIESLKDNDGTSIVLTSRFEDCQCTKTKIHAEELSDLQHKLRKAQDDAAKALKTLEQERKLWKSERETLEIECARLEKKIKKQQAHISDLTFQYIPKVCPELKAVGPVRYNINEEKGKRIDDYVLDKEIASGSYGTVFEGHVEGKPQASYAIKVMKKKKFETIDALKELNKEITILQDHGSHPNITTLHNVLHAPENIYMILDKACPKDLHSLFNMKRLPGVAIKPIFKGILNALDHLHKNGVCHLDVKPENVLIAASAFDSNNRIKAGYRITAQDVILCDFGFAQLSENYSIDSTLDDGDQSPDLDVTLYGHACGTPGFYAPEMIIKRSYEGRKADMWSVGVLLMEISYSLPRSWLESYDMAHEDDVKFEEGLIDCLEEVKDYFYRDCDDQACVHDILVNHLLLLNPSERATAAQVMQHPWFQCKAPPGFSSEW